MTTKWDYYKPGSVLWSAGLKILDLSDAGLRMSDTWYQVRHLCCQLEATMSHTKIRKRVRENQSLCRTCGHQKSGKTKHARTKHGRQSGVAQMNRDFPPLEFPLPTWDPPKLRPPKGWVPYRGSGRR